MKDNDLLAVATIGKVVGLRGELKLHSHSDFSEQFVDGAKFTINSGEEVKIESYNPNRSLVKFYNFNVREDASRLTNQKLFTTIAESRKNCVLGKKEFFWFDIIGLDVIDEDQNLGKVKDIERIANSDYLLIETSKKLVEDGLPKRFYIPYIDRYVVEVVLDNKIIKTIDAYGLLESS